MESEVRIISPEDAEELLRKQSVHNRRVRQNVVNELVFLMETGSFKLTHQGIAIDWNGMLVDGQHRLRAIIKYGKPVQMLVSTAVDPELYKVIDRGARRTLSELTGRSQHVVAVCRFLNDIVSGRTNATVVNIIDPYIWKFSSKVDRLLMHCPTSVKSLSMAPIKAAAAVCMFDRCEQTAMDSYRRCVLRQYADMRPIEVNFSKWISDRTIHTSMRNEVFYWYSTIRIQTLLL